MAWDACGTPVDEAALRQIFLDARTYNGWLDRPVSDDCLRQIVDLMKMGPTSANCQPIRIRFLKSREAKERLRPFLMEGNVEKTMSAPVVAILAHDLEFHERLPRYFPHTDAKSWFEGNRPLIEETAFRNGTLQAAYFIMAARALGLDCGPMSGFDQDGVNREFFAGTSIRANFLCNLGYGDPASLFERSPRPEFGEIAEIL
ncbi:MAG TPA: malonic semialdehyde reductase [Bryobacterales bacterium]|nr:malonic semialdehyde reductase [Bryobacterales bacterium]